MTIDRWIDEEINVSEKLNTISRDVKPNHTFFSPSGAASSRAP